MIDVGDQTTLTYPSKPASPATVTVSVVKPDSTVDGPFSAMSGSYPYTWTQFGRHTVLWQSTGPSDSYTDTIDVAATASTAVVSLADAKAQLRVTQSTNDEELRTFLAATTEIVEHYAGTVIPQTFTEYHNGGGTSIVTRHTPILSVASVTEVIGTITWTLTNQPVGSATDYYGYSIDDAENGVIRRRSNASWLIPFTGGYGNIAIIYTAGRKVVPSSMQIAARLILAHLWETRRLAGPKPANADNVETVPGLGYAVPTEAIELLDAFEEPLGIG